MPPPSLLERRRCCLGEIPAKQGARGSDLLGHLAATVIALITNPEEVTRLGFCTAPNCGGLYRQSRPDQKWCHAGCGTRARADRQYQRKKQTR